MEIGGFRPLLLKQRSVERHLHRQRPLRVAGVGHGSQVAEYDCVLPIVLRKTNGQILPGSFTTPTIPNSDLPGLLGLDSLEKLGAVVDFGNRTVYVPGAEGVALAKGMPPGTDSFDLERAPSGHLLLPCTFFRGRVGEHSETPVSMLSMSSTDNH